MAFGMPAFAALEDTRPPLRAEVFGPASGADITRPRINPFREPQSLETIPEATPEASDGILTTLPPTNASTPLPEPPAIEIISDPTLSGFRPKYRPFGQSEQSAAGVDIANPERAAIKPQRRPVSVLEKAVENSTQEAISRQITADIERLEEQERQFNLATASEFAVTSSLLPKKRPAGIAKLARELQAKRQTETKTVAATSASAPAVTPESETAPVERSGNIFARNKLSLVGVYGTSSSRRALIRTPTGRYVKVKPGQRISGWRVAAIGESSVRVTKGSQTRTLRLP